MYWPATGRNVSAAKVLGLPPGQQTFETRREAKKAREDARMVLYDGASRPGGVTVGGFYERWIRDALFETSLKGQPRKASTLATYHQSARRFCRDHAGVPMRAVSDDMVAGWLARGGRPHEVFALQAMWADAMSKKAGRLILSSPFAGLGIVRGSRADVQPPTLDEVWAMVRHARELCGPGFAAWLQFAAFTGLRPGELDGLERAACDIPARRVDVRQQWSRAGGLTTPKNGKARRVVMPPPAVEALEGVAPGRWAFESERGSHFTPQSRSRLWDRVRVAMGWQEPCSRVVLYTATRHFACWYFYEELRMDAEDVAVQLGHEDHGERVRSTYGHRSRERALGRLESAFERGPVRRLKAVGE